ncbi:MAG: 2-dehydropantoate 2-reductase [Acidobacteria bacterium 21-70-11]|nr:MAG: 2-dehydropantoate 2-reductase [Acidobacteria bacterium 21-70-11]
MKIAIIGAGGVGGYFGARLAASGEDVTFIARGAHLEAMRKNGLRVLSALGDLTLEQVTAESDPARVGQVDVVMVAVKLWSTDDAMQTAKPLVGPATGVISFQNGVEAIATATRHFGEPHVMGGVAHIAAVIDRPGVIRNSGTLARLTFGELDGGASPRGTALLEACRRAGIDASWSDDIERAIWEKFVFIVGLSGMTSLTRMPTGPIRSDPVTRGMLRDVMGEVAAVARGRGIGLAPEIVDAQMRFIDTLPPGMISSMLGDLTRGKRLEVEWLSGAVVRLGMETKVPTPLNRAIYAALKLHADGAPPPPEDRRNQ